MGAPATAGKYVSGLSGMAIDDYIKCVYEAPYSNVAGYFSQLGNKQPWTELHTRINGGEEVVTKEILTGETEPGYKELPTTPSSENISGYFYLIKVDYGMLIADRMVQQAISWESLNKKNYIYGGVFDTVNSRTVKYVDIRTSTKTYDSNTDTNVDVTHNIDPTIDVNDAFDETLAPNITDAATYQAWFNDYDKKLRRQRHTEVVCDTTNNVTTTTITITTWHYAYIPDTLPDKIMNAIIDTTVFTNLTHDDEKNIDVLSIPYNSEVEAISSVLDTITSAKCIVQKDDGSTYSFDVAITSWDYSNYVKGSTGNLIIEGTLKDMDIDPNNPMQNPNEIKASVVVMIQIDQVDHVSEIPSLTVASGTSRGELATTLASHAPSCTVFYNKYGATEGTEPEQLSEVAITWDTSTYEIGVLGEQWIEGEIADLSSSGIGNDADVKARVKVITEAVV